ncbi:MAG: trypsin-like serine protease [Polyangiaceae bacterium]
MKLIHSVHRVLPLALTAAISAAAAEGCAANAPELTDSDDEAIVGGIPATSTKFDAVGAIMFQPTAPAGQPAQAKRATCTGTLIAPDVVLTAKHCIVVPPSQTPDGKVHALLDLGAVSFAVGANSAAPKREVAVKSLRVAKMNEPAGQTGFGSDVGLYILSEPIVGVTPLPIAKVKLTTELEGKSFVAMGYGVQNEVGTAGTRVMGNVGLSKLDEKPNHLLYSSLDNMLQAYAAQLGRALTDAEKTQAEKDYNADFIPDHEAHVGARPGDVQPCFGDSGGPLLRKVEGKLSVFGVASWGRNNCSGGTVYATLGASPLEMLEEVFPAACGTTTSNGVCQGTEVVRCSPLGEGPRRIIRIDCADVDQSCRVVGGKALCVD